MWLNDVIGFTVYSVNMVFTFHPENTKRENETVSEPRGIVTSQIDNIVPSFGYWQMFILKNVYHSPNHCTDLQPKFWSQIISFLRGLQVLSYRQQKLFFIVTLNLKDAEQF